MRRRLRLVLLLLPGRVGLVGRVLERFAETLPLCFGLAADLPLVTRFLDILCEPPACFRFFRVSPARKIGSANQEDTDSQAP